MKFDKKIRQMRLKAGLTQEQLANKLGVSAQSVSKWENDISMPDITLLPIIAETFGITIDELFDLTVDQKLNRIENRVDIEEEISEQAFKDYEEFLLLQLLEGTNRVRILSLLAHLYNHRIEADSRRVCKYGKEAILLDPTKKDCQWLLNRAEGHVAWDWNFFNHSNAVEFYKEVIDNDKGTPKSSLPYYYLIDNLLADNRTIEAEKYLKEFTRLPSASPIMIDIYRAYIALANYDVFTADNIIESCIDSHKNDTGYLFEAAQYYARRCMYEKSIALYKNSWELSKKPRFTDALHGIATIYKIMGNKKEAEETYDKILECLVEEWGYSKEDRTYIEVEREKSKVGL